MGLNKTAHTKSANVFLAVGDLLRTLRGGGLGKVEQALTNPVAMGRRGAVGNIGKAVSAPVLAPTLGVMGVASKVDHAAKAHDPLRLLQMRSREAAVKGMSNRPVDRRQFVTDMMRGVLNPDVRQAVGTLGTAAVRGAASLAEKIASMEKRAGENLDAFLAELPPERRDKYETLAAAFGMGPKYKPKPEKFHRCPKCGEDKAAWREAHADTGMDEMELRCRGCGATTEQCDMPAEKSASTMADVQREHVHFLNTCPDCGSVTKCKCSSCERARTNGLCDSCSMKHEKSAAEAVRKPRTEYDEHCPHCDHQFTEKGGPRRKHNGESDEEWKAGFDSGDYDEHCPHCDGIVDRRELSDEEINAVTWGGDKVRESLRARRETSRKRKADRETTESAAVGAVEKQGGASTNLLRAFLNGEKPLFHAVANANQRGLLQHPRAMTATEAIARGGAGSIEGGGGFARYTGGLDVAPKLTRDAAALNAKDLMRQTVRKNMSSRSPEPDSYWIPRHHVVGMALKGPYGDTARASLLSAVSSGAGKNWGTIAFSQGSPLRRYGDVGVMTTPGRMRNTGGLFGGNGGLKEVVAFPEWRLGRDGMPASLRLPSAPGKIFYHPTPDNAPFVRELIQQHGRHNVLPWNRATRTRLKQVGGSDAGIGTINPRRAAASLDSEIAALPGFDARYGTVDKWADDIADSVRTKSAAAKCPGCGRDFPKGEPLPDVTMCEVCERYGPPRTKSAAIAAALRKARNETHTDPTPAQARAGNYSKGEIALHGLTIKIENPKDTTRRGYDKDGKQTWSRVMRADYGYFKNSRAADGDAVDVFIGPDLESDLVVVVDQYRGETFDESKFIMAVTTRDQGEKLYLQHYPKDWTLGPVSTTTVAQLKEWLKNGSHKKPFKGQMVKAASRFG